MAKQPPFNPSPARPAYPTGTQSRGGGIGISMKLGGRGEMRQNLVITPRVRAEVNEVAVEAATMLPTKE